METINEWNEKIMHQIEKIRQDHPELIGFIDEMPITIPDETNPHITIKILKDFYESLLKIERSGEHLANRIYTR